MTKTRDLADLGGGFIQAGTGAQQRTVESKLQDVVSVLDFIPAGIDTATTDCAAYIQAAIDSGVSSVFIPAGTYRIDSSINLVSDVNIYGVGSKSIIQQFGSAAFTNTASIINTGVSNLKIIYSKGSPDIRDCAFRLGSHQFCNFGFIVFDGYDSCTVFERYPTSSDTFNCVYNSYHDIYADVVGLFDVAAGYSSLTFKFIGDGSTTILNTNTAWAEQFDSSVIVLKEDVTRTFTELTLTTDYTVSYPAGNATVTLTSPAAVGEIIYVMESQPDASASRKPISNNVWNNIYLPAINNRGHVAWRWVDAECFVNSSYRLSSTASSGRIFDFNPYLTRGGQAGDFATFNNLVLTRQVDFGTTNERIMRLGPGTINTFGNGLKVDKNWVDGSGVFYGFETINNGSFTLTGTVSITSGSPTVTGSGTAFTKELSLVGSAVDTVEIDDTVYAIASIDSDTQLTLSTNASTTAAGVPITRYNFSDRAGYIFDFSDIGAGSLNRRYVGTDGGAAKTKSRTLDYGTATIIAGDTNVTVPHRLWRRPLSYEITLTPQSLLGGRSLSVSTIGDTSFRINLSSTSTANLTIGYKIELLTLN